jgi:hypothetical protein
VISLKSFMKPRLPTRLLFVHIPKCGGQSVENAVRNKFRIGNPQPDFEILRRANILLENKGELDSLEKPATLLLLYFAEIGAEYLSGHYPITPDIIDYLKCSKAFYSVTILRSPFERLVSNYVYRKVRLWMLGYEEKSDADNPDLFVRQEREDLTKFYNSNEGSFQLNIYTRMLGGGDLELAKKTLLKFDLIGNTDEVDRFSRELSKKLGHEVKVNHLNRLSDRPFQKEVKLLKSIFEDERIKHDLVHKLRHEIELYEFSQNHVRSLEKALM